MDRNKKHVIVGYKKDGSDLITLCIRRKVSLHSSISSSQSALLSQESSQQAYLWHLRLGHVSLDKMKLMVANGSVNGLTLSSLEGFFCEGAFGKQSRRPFKTPKECETQPGGRIHVDVCPFSHKSIGGARYFILFKDEARGFRRVFFMKEKNQSLKQFLNDVDTLTDGRSRNTVQIMVPNLPGHPIKTTWLRKGFLERLLLPTLLK